MIVVMYGTYQVVVLSSLHQQEYITNIKYIIAVFDKLIVSLAALEPVPSWSTTPPLMD